jgi:metallo-beta-lactamase family protein
VTDINKKYQKDFNPSVKEKIESGDDIFNFSGLKIVRSAEESKEIENIKGPKIILAGSGMSEGGRVLNHEFYYLPEPSTTLILAGYQPLGTLGRMLEDGIKEITLAPRGGEITHSKIPVRAEIKKIEGYSSHKDSEHLIEFVEEASHGEASEDGERSRTIKLKKVFVIMGEPKSSLFLCQRIRDYVGIEAIYPEEGRVYGL